MARLSGGAARGRLLVEPVPQGVRPTAARVREALFSIVGQDLEGTTFLDAFGGSAAVALDAWSRGAEVTLVERDRRALVAVRKNVAGLGASVRVVAGDVVVLAGSLAPFDGVFADPPYAAELEPILAALAPLARHWLVVETERGRELPPELGSLALDRERRYGRTTLWVYRPPREDLDAPAR